MGHGKTEQLQIRLAAAEKAAIQRAAARAGMDMSAWVLAKLLPHGSRLFHTLSQALAAADSDECRYVLAELNDFLSGLAPREFAAAVAERPAQPLDLYLANYLAAMIETAAHRLGVDPPAWTAEIAALEEPVFGTTLQGLRLHLLLNAPPPFRRRNIFVDSSIGDRV
jgi:uncharacterized protein (DUF1778 family)